MTGEVKKRIEKKVEECIKLVNDMMVIDDIWTPEQKMGRVLECDVGPSIAESALSRLEDIVQLLKEKD